jgi:hypothetical protein
VRGHGRALQCASPELRADRDVVLTAVREEGLALQHASPELRADREVVEAAVSRNGCALEHACAELRAGEPQSLINASLHLKTSKDIAAAAKDHALMSALAAFEAGQLWQQLPAERLRLQAESFAPAVFRQRLSDLLLDWWDQHRRGTLGSVPVG